MATDTQIIEQALASEFNNNFRLRVKRPKIIQVLAPLYHADGDMMDIYISPGSEKLFRISDFGATLMRLSYTYEIDSDAKEKIFNRILAESDVNYDDGNLFIETDPDMLYPTLMCFAQTVTKIFNMRLYRREVVSSMFYEQLQELFMETLNIYNPEQDYYPIEDSPEYKVDYKLNSRPRPFYVFGVNSNDKARLTTITCQQLTIINHHFQSIIIFEDMTKIGKSDLDRLLNIADKPFTNFKDTKVMLPGFLKREYTQLNP